MYGSNTALRKRARRVVIRASLEHVSKAWSWLFLLLLLLGFSLANPRFLDFVNLQNIVTNMAFVLLLALGQTFVIITGGLDLSTGYVMGLASVVAATVVMLIGASVPLFLTVLAALLCGLLLGQLPGLINGLIIARLSVPPFIVTLGMYGIACGVGFLLEHEQPVTVTLEGVNTLGNGYLFYIISGMGIQFWQVPVKLAKAHVLQPLGVLPFQLLVSIVLIIACYWLLAQTRFGRHTYAIGGNAEAALRAGIAVARHKILIYMLSAGLASLAGVLYVFRYTSGTADGGNPLLIDSIAAVVIGGASLFGGEGTIMGTVIGTLIIAVLQNGLVILGINAYWQFIATGLVIILAVLVDQLKGRFAA
ncbi:ribose ABC transporter [Ktedonosporobacter rubrisoli]|uniref:Autoinducer 2 import system permease protein LsrD n=1 Tax=Ktedonosporobacter rubrisoli TaxID=2509675 RepID=A0A4P6JT67_KTERU|nr:ribose ABC transporter [Ktedonosporobacter rubrisoli]QBD78758.1 ribose ABC transporter [Ktedonosporobacter rubrisoli]